MLRFLRIAFSATCGIICLLLVVLWVRSFWYYDWFEGPVFKVPVPAPEGWHAARTVSLRSWKGVASIFTEIGMLRDDRRFRDYWNHEIETDSRIMREPTWRLSYLRNAWLEINAPYWFLVALTAAIAIAPWTRHLRFRFSLRTLLIAMTLVAVVLGAVIYAAG